MGRKEKKNKSHDESLEQSERELFLDAFYQNEDGALKKYVHQEKKREFERASTSANLDDSELFLRAVSELESIFFKKRDDLTPRVSPQNKPRRAKKFAVDAELDLHGLYAEDAIKALYRFLDREKQRGSRMVLIVHGKGSGVLKNVVWSVLGTHPAVDDFYGAHAKMGGSGAIVVRLARRSRK